MARHRGTGYLLLLVAISHAASTGTGTSEVTGCSTSCCLLFCLLSSARSQLALNLSSRVVARSVRYSTLSCCYYYYYYRQSSSSLSTVSSQVDRSFISARLSLSHQRYDRNSPDEVTLLAPSQGQRPVPIHPTPFRPLLPPLSCPYTPRRTSEKESRRPPWMS